MGVKEGERGYADWEEMECGKVDVGRKSGGSGSNGKGWM